MSADLPQLDARFEDREALETELRANLVDGRAFVYRPVEEPTMVASRAVKQIIDRFCGGSAEELVLGLVDNKVLSPKALDRLARKIAERRKAKS